VADRSDEKEASVQRPIGLPLNRTRPEGAFGFAGASLSECLILVVLKAGLFMPIHDPWCSERGGTAGHHPRGVPAAQHLEASLPKNDGNRGLRTFSESTKLARICTESLLDLVTCPVFAEPCSTCRTTWSRNERKAYENRSSGALLVKTTGSNTTKYCFILLFRCRR
jgi:hypothetical protein